MKFKRNNLEPFVILKVEELTYLSEEEDIAVLRVTNNYLDNSDKVVCSKLESESDCNNLLFRGYPKWLQDNSSAKTFECKIEENDTTVFYVKTKEIQDLTTCTAIDETSNGISGSGVFEIKNGKLFLIGLVSELRNSQGTFGHLKCVKLDDVFYKIGIPLLPLSNRAQDLFVKSEKINQDAIEKMIADLKESKSDRYKNLERKCKDHLYEEEVDEMIYCLLNEYFEAQIQLSNMGKVNSFVRDDFDNASSQLSRKVKIRFNKRKVKSNSEAQDIYGAVSDLFKEILNEVSNGKTNLGFVRQFAEHATVELLLNCDLDFKNA